MSPSAAETRDAGPRYPCVCSLARPGAPPSPPSVSTRDTAQCRPACTLSTCGHVAQGKARQGKTAYTFIFFCRNKVAFLLWHSENISDIPAGLETKSTSVDFRAKMHANMQKGGLCARNLFFSAVEGKGCGASKGEVIKGRACHQKGRQAMTA